MEGDPNVGSSSSSAIKKRKKPSPVWNEMIKYPDADGKLKAECKHCKKTFDADSKKGTTHLKNHLERCPANPKRKSGSDGRDGDDQHQSLSPSIKTKELASLIKENSVRGVIKHFSSDQERMNWPDCPHLDPRVLNSRKDEILQLYQEEKEKLCQFLNNLSCRFTLQLVCRNRGMDDMDDGCLLVVNYIDDSWERQSKIISWERQSKIISFWHCPRDHIKNFTEAVKQSCMDWKIDMNICSLVLSLEIDTADGLYNEIGKMESWFSQRRSLPFAGCLLSTYYLRDYVGSVLKSEDYVGDGIRSIKECAAYVQNKSTSDKLIQLDGAVRLAISMLDYGPPVWGFGYFQSAVDVKEVFSALEQFDSEFRSINLSKQKWDEVTATYEHLKLLEDVSISISWERRDIPIIVDLPYVHKILKDRCNHTIEDCLLCQKVMKGAIDLFFSKNYSVRVIAVILDPRLKMDGLQLRYKEIYGSDADRYLEKVNKDFRDVYDAYAATASSNSKSYEMLDAMGRPSSPKSELDLYMKELKVPAVKKFDKLAWWRGNAPFYPTLARMARDYLALEITTADAAAKHALFALIHDVDCIYQFPGIPEIITPLLLLKGFLSSPEN
ncbi:zinc finger BED domain-containing protein RICESLEEPER 1 [Citrus sinensis]|uniref:Zinc finger BED domain-containing protein RICESLEEPER 1 n=2 Tax=Citrus sinensis TaxID=2711 RepID=A0ACB8MD85_CITSI|nr:zinc finger BED domain-containing protein RICESLEEPER 1 [Citrus sinensis]